MNNKVVRNLIVRYFLLILLGLGNLSIIYFLFTPLTVYPVFLFFKQFYNAHLSTGNVIQIGIDNIRLISACIAGAAYYLLLILNLATPLNFKKRMQSLAFLIFSFLILNIIRIIVFSIFFLKKYPFFDLSHELVWYFGSSVLIIILWFVNVWLFKIKEIPVYTDARNLLQDMINSKNRTKRL